MKNIKMILVTVTIVISVQASAIDTNTTISTSWAEPATQYPAGDQYLNGELVYPNYIPRTTTTTTTTTTTNATPLLSTVPQFNVKDLKVTADGNCQIIKNGSVVKTDVYAGSPCQKIYGTKLQAASTTTTSTVEVIPDYYLEPDWSALQDFRQQSYQQY